MLILGNYYFNYKTNFEKRQFCSKKVLEVIYL